MAAVENYLNLVPVANASKAKFNAFLAALTQPFVDIQNFYVNLPLNFDLDYAIGAQLDAVGKWLGLPRQVAVPIENVYFSFNIAGIGWNQGVWFGPGQPSEGLVSLPDDTYRQMLYIKAMANKWDGTMQAAQEMLTAMFASSLGTVAILQDNQDMSISYVFQGVPPPTLLLALLEGDYIPMRPAGVRVAAIITP